MKKPSLNFPALWVLLLGLAAVATFTLWQVNAIERRLIVQQQQLRSFGEATERVSVELSRLQAGGATGGAQGPGASRGCELGRVLHPEVADLLGEQQTHWPPPGSPLDGRLTVGWPSGDPKSFNPLTENGAELGELALYTGSNLASRNRFTEPDTWYGELACRVEVTDEAKEYTIYLRRGVEWPEPGFLDVTSEQYSWLKGGHPVTAHDFVFGFDMLMHPQVENGFMKSYYEDLESWKALDDHTLVIRWKKRLYASTELTLSAPMLPKHIFAFDESGREIPKETLGLRFNQHWFGRKGTLGVGPYNMVEYTPGTRIVLRRNEQFFGDRPAIQEIHYPIYTDPEQTLLRLKSGELDVGQLRPSHYRQELLDWQGKPENERPKNSPFLNGKLNCQKYEAPVYRYIGWNSDRPIFSDPRVRRAMTLALNRQEIVDNVFVGLGEVAHGPFLPETGNLDPTIDPLAFDPARAAALLDEAGWRDTDGDGLRDKVVGGRKMPFEFSLLIYATSPEYAALANIFKEELLKIGVKLDVVSAEWSLMQKRIIEKDFDAYTGGWAMSWESDPHQLWHSSQADVPQGSNSVGFRSKEADALIEALRVTFEPGKRREMHRKIHRLIYDAQAYTFLLTGRAVLCTSSRVKNILLSKVRPIADTRPWVVESSQ